MRSRRPLAALALSLAFATPVVAQAPDQSDVQLRADEVQLDVVVRDHAGRPVTDLRPEDFEVFEDGVRQVPTSVRFLGATPDSPIPTPLAGEYDLTIVVVDHAYFGDSGEAALVREALAQFVTGLGDRDRVAIMTVGPNLSIVQPFTADRTRLLDATNRATARRVGFDLGPRSSTYRSGRSGGARTDVGKPYTFEVDMGSGSSLLLSYWNEAPVLAPSTKSPDTLAMRDEALARIRASLDAMDDAGSRAGRKAVVFISPGMPLEPSPSLEVSLNRLIGASTRRGITFYTVNSRGLRAPTGGAPSESLLDWSTYDPTLVALANRTGGSATYNSNRFSRPFDELRRDRETSYVVSYASSNPVQDGRFRKVRIRVRRGGTDARTRQGYFAIADTGSSPVVDIHLTK